MTLYTCYYKKRFFWHKIKRVKGDWIAKENPMIRKIVQEDETEWMLPCIWLIKFSKERHVATLERMSKDAGKKIEENPR